MNGTSVRGLSGGRNALGGHVDVVQPLLARVPILDRAAREADLERAAHALSDTGCVSGEAILEVG